MEIFKIFAGSVCLLIGLILAPHWIAFMFAAWLIYMLHIINTKCRKYGIFPVICSGQRKIIFSSSR